MHTTQTHNRPPTGQVHRTQAEEREHRQVSACCIMASKRARPPDSATADSAPADGPYLAPDAAAATDNAYKRAEKYYKLYKDGRPPPSLADVIDVDRPGGHGDVETVVPGSTTSISSASAVCSGSMVAWKAPPTDPAKSTFTGAATAGDMSAKTPPHAAIVIWDFIRKPPCSSSLGPRGPISVP